MLIELNEVDQAIEVAFKEASAVEIFARRLEERISQIEGARALLPPRKYGQPIDAKAIRANLSLSTLIMRDSAELSHYLGLDPSIKRRMDEEREAQKLSGLPPGDLCVSLRREFGKRLRWNELLMQPELMGQPIPGTTLEQLYVALS